MPPKGRKSALWSRCEACSADVPSKESKIHKCVDDANSWSAPFVLNDTVHTYLELDNTKESNLRTEVIENVIFLHRSCLQQSNFVIGDPVVIQCVNESLPPIVRRIWPSTSTNCNLLTATISPHCLDPKWRGKHKFKVTIASFTGDTLYASSINVTAVEPDLIKNPDFIEYVKVSQKNKIMCLLNAFNVYFFGKNITLHISDVKIMGNDQLSLSSNDSYFIINENTQWIFDSNVDKDGTNSCSSICIGGVDNIIDDINYLIDIALDESADRIDVKKIKCVLLHGPSGVGKSLLCKYMSQKTKANTVEIFSSEVYSKFFGETEASLKKIFDEASENSPSIIIIDDIDTLCRKSSSSDTDQDRRVLSTLSLLLENVHKRELNIFVLATTNQIDVLDPTLRRYGRIDHEIEIPVPDKKSRYEIMKKLFTTFPHNLSEGNIENVANELHGFVGADISNLITQAATHALSERKADVNLKIELSDIQIALKEVKPSAMREILIDIPDVRWNDIGGQNELKLKLKQAVEWPLKHSDSFIRLGIKPPSGLLMYGPPGCSKTMIAKALANESGLNFLSIKGPELFSKWVGESERAVRQVFRKARQVAPSIIFFDEIDALGSERSKQNSGSNVQERVLAQILTELDGISPLGNVTVIAATNRPDKIDSALLRPGRLDRIVYVPLPDKETRRSIFQIKFQKMPIAKDVCIEDLIQNTENYSGAEIQAVCHEAALKALEEDMNCSVILKRHFDVALQYIQPRTPSDLLLIYESFERKSYK